MLYVIHGTDGDNAAKIREEQRDAHFKYLADHKDVLVLAGAALADDGVGRLGSIYVVNLPSREAAEKFAADEPFGKSGLFKTQTITRMRRGQWNPGSAPKTEEGN